MTVLEAVKQSKTPTLMQKGSIETAQNMLKPGETVLYAMTANICTDPTIALQDVTLKEQAYVVLVITDQRVFYVQKLLGALSSAFIPLWEVQSVMKVPDGKYWWVQIKGINKRLLIEHNRKPIEALHDAIQSALAHYTAPAAASAPAPAASPDLNVEQLMKLKELYDAGILTEEEFSAKKAQILGI